MTSEFAEPNEAYVWIWFPGETEPVVTGRLAKGGDRLLFNYGVRYRNRKNAIPIYEPELPLGAGLIEPPNGLPMASCIRDGSSDAWGRRVIMNKLTGHKPAAGEVPDISELTFLLQSGSDRIGARDFQASATQYVPRLAAEASLDELLAAAECIEKGLPLTPALEKALEHGTSIGEQWTNICREADLSRTDQALFAGRQFLNAYCQDQLGDNHKCLRDTFSLARSNIMA